MSVCELGYQIGLENDIEDGFQKCIRRYKDNNAYDKTVEELQKFFDSLEISIPKSLTDTYNPHFRINVECFLSGIHNGSVDRSKNKQNQGIEIL